MIVDAHLDLAYNALRGRDVLLPAREQTQDPEELPTVGLPDLRAADVGLVCATVYCEPASPGKSGYTTPAEAGAAGHAQLSWYERERDAGHFRFVTQRDELPEAPPPGPLPIILLIEGADPILNAADLAHWHARGVRAVGLAWRRTRYAGGTGDPGPLTPEGVQLVRAIDSLSIIHDASHLADESFWNLMEISPGSVMATHSNCRAIAPTSGRFSERNLTDSMIRAIAQRDGVTGINFFNRFLVHPSEFDTRPAFLSDVVNHIRHICDLLGDDRHVGIGSDMDGGLGRQHIPREIQTSADLPLLADVLADAGFSDQSVRGFLSDNWLGFFRRSLP